MSVLATVIAWSLLYIITIEVKKPLEIAVGWV